MAESDRDYLSRPYVFLRQTESMEGTHGGRMEPDSYPLHAADGGEERKECDKDVLGQRTRKLIRFQGALLGK